MKADQLTIAILGGGPSALFMYKRLVECGHSGLEIHIYEKGDRLGPGMPYSHLGANDEHITNVSGNEIPDLVTPVAEWINTVPKDTLRKYRIDANTFNAYKTLPRLLFGQYLADQFKLLQQQAKKNGIETQVFYNSAVSDIMDDPDLQQVIVTVGDEHTQKSYDRVIVCTGHYWPKTYEDKISGYFDSPYPPAKLKFSADYAIAIRGSSLTAIDAIRTLARQNGSFKKGRNGILKYKLKSESNGFRIVMHSRNGLLPALRFHLDDSHLGKNTVLSAEEVASIRQANDGFLPLDYVFEKNFKEGVRKNDPEFYERIRDLSMEQFVNMVMELRERLDAFKLLAAEFSEAEKSIKRRESIYWKEMLGVLSFAMNYPAKYFSAEDMLRMQRVLMPLIAVVIAYVPQSSAAEMLAMHQAGCLDIVAVGTDSKVEPVGEGGIIFHYTDEDNVQHSNTYRVFVDCIGQPHLSYEELPYPGLFNNKTVSPARLYFRDRQLAMEEKNKGNDKVKEDREGRYYLLVPGITINDSFQAVDEYNALNERIYVMAVPFIGGFNPDYSGLDFGEAASATIIKALVA
ncbi:FAD/NAD(P)-binding protein [Mucilaginibacter sp. RS28]|uniref:FAD/NAD(P)-binding protein n=1 Tax=Mucilaginibacter straminoryzae TaxID=2932774 RepID=A0A9X2BB94_9SPHI|nr:FAD/NAD(P)-binding protein [Mucilaginibacter straminoryzae]MCJ8211575.1 FAD/NAD(P)-binding protein [Mucilaginibacter straminoryzae]